MILRYHNQKHTQSDREVPPRSQAEQTIHTCDLWKGTTMNGGHSCDKCGGIPRLLRMAYKYPRMCLPESFSPKRHLTIVDFF